MKRQLIIAALSAITLSVAPVTERVKTPRVEAMTSVQAQKDTEARVAEEKKEQERKEKEEKAKKEKEAQERKEREEKERQEKKAQERKAEEEKKQKEEAERLAEEKKQAEEQAKAKAEEEAQVAADKTKDESVAKEKEAEEKAKVESEAKENEAKAENDAKDDEDTETQKTEATESDDEKTEDEDEEADKVEDDKDKADKEDSDDKLALVSVPSVSFGTVAAGQSRNAKASGSLKVVNSQKKTGWMVTVSANGFKDTKGQTLDGAVLNLTAGGQNVSGGDNGKLPVAQSVGNLVKGGTALKAGAGTTGTFTVNYAADAFGIKLPDNIAAGEYSSQLSWNLTSEPES